MLHTEVIENKSNTNSNTNESLMSILSRRAQKIMFWLILLFVISPIFVLIKSITLPYHDSFYINTNQRTLMEFWYNLLKLSGYFGLLFTFIIAIGYASKMMHEKGWLIKALQRNPVLLFLSLLLVWSFFSCLSSDNPIRSFYGTEYLRDGFLSYLAYAGLFCSAYFTRRQNDRMIITRFFTGTAAIISILVLFSNETMERLFSMQRYAAIFQNINHCGYYLCLSLMTAATLFLIEKRRILAYVIWLPVYALINLALMKNRSFGPYLAVISGLILLLVLTFLYVKKIKLPAMILVSVFIVVSFGYNIKTNYIKNETATLRKDIVNIVENNEMAPAAGSYRWVIWTRSVHYALEKPLLGYGPENLGKRFGQDNLDTGRPHNAILQLAASLGIPAAIFFIAALLFFYLDLIRNRKKLTVVTLSLHAAVFAYLLSSMFGVSAFYTTPFFFIFFGMTCNLFRGNAEETESVPASAS